MDRKFIIKKIVKIICFVLLITFIIPLCACSEQETYTPVEGTPEERAESIRSNIRYKYKNSYKYTSLQDHIKSKLKNPSSFTVNSISFTFYYNQNDLINPLYMKVSVDYSAQNSFGGYERASEAGTYKFVDEHRNFESIYSWTLDEEIEKQGLVSFG